MAVLLFELVASANSAGEENGVLKFTFNLKHAGRSKSAHNEGMLRCVECSADVGLTFALQYVYASEETMRVSQDSLASLGLFAAVVDGCWCG